MGFSIIKTGTAGAMARQYFNNRIGNAKDMYYQLLPEELVARAVEMGEGVLSDTGALVIDSGEFTGRSPVHPQSCRNRRRRFGTQTHCQ